ncbi:hypothetical protein FPHYL_14031 [Fusarium phyllophilum]|uniref:Uncharacterized protein n=1 Tax=Fusarium phyllophilum TaxID=47803 RepID=A0A8H5MK00_9HYPO|nr:hypothetical protein FPHYL_14031 [Fusarium phyllophilum]
MGMKRRASDLDHEAKKMKSDDSNGNDEASSRNWVQTTPASSYQPVTDLNGLPQTVREQLNFLLQALSDVSPESLSGANILDQINAINSDVRRPIFTYKPPEMEITIGHSPHRSNNSHDCDGIGCARILSRINSEPYANGGYFTVEAEHPRLHMGDFVLPCEEDGGPTLKKSLGRITIYFKYRALPEKP